MAANITCGIFLTAGINGWIGGGAAFALFILGRLLYGSLGAAAPPAVQALVAGRTTRAERTRALTLIGSAFGLGTIIGPALSPYLVAGHWGSVEIGLAGPAFFAAMFGAGMLIAVARMLPNDRVAPSRVRTARPTPIRRSAGNRAARRSRPRSSRRAAPPASMSPIAIRASAPG